MRAEILTIGDELCRGEIVDTNSALFAGKLWDLAITTRWMTSCNDDAADMRAALETATRRADLVICSGGLGPTEDDLTVDVVAALAGRTVVIDEPARANMMERFKGRGLTGPEILEIQLRQVRVPDGARVHGNPAGLAPVFEVPINGVPVICTPGIPREILSAWPAVEARLRELPRTEMIARKIYRVFGRGESQISQVARGLVDDVPGASIHYQVKFPETLVKLVVRSASQPDADAALERLEGQLRERLAGFLYGVGDETLVERTMRRLLERELTVATAESCTGGMIGEMLTRLPGSSRAFVGGAITYSNAEKVRQLGVAQATLDAHGAVSEEVVREMALGARARFGTDLAVSVSGVAGPDGGTPEKPVGTVWLALASARGVSTKKLAWPGARDMVRTLSAWWALKMIDEADVSAEAAAPKGAAD